MQFSVRDKSCIRKKEKGPTISTGQHITIVLVRAVPVGNILEISGDFRSVGNVERGKKVPEAFTTRNKDSCYIHQKLQTKEQQQQLNNTYRKLYFLDFG